MKKLLVTGGAGFIGSNFLYFLNDTLDFSQYEVHVLDALTYSGHYETIASLIDSKKFHFFEIDIRNNSALNELFEEHQYDGVLHFAAESHVDRSIVDPGIFLETNVNGTLNLLHASLALWKKNSEFRYLQVGTDEVYGHLTETEPAFTEQTHIAPNSPYSASKASADLLVRAYHQTYGLNTVITRCSNNYGRFQFPEKLIPLMIHNIVNDKKLPVYGDGSNIRDWIHVDDHNRGVWAVFEKGRSGEVYNLGGDAEMKNLDLVKLLLDSLEKPHSLIEFVTDRLGHDFRYAMNFSKAKEELGWEPKISFEEGIQDTIKWYLENKSWVESVLAKSS